jgi:hypothetical protein
MLGIVPFVLLSLPGFGAVVFQDNFELGALVTTDTNWASNTSGTVVLDPLNPTNHVLEFTANGSGGDLFSAAIPGSSQMFLSFDYLYLNQPYGGGFIGVDLAGEVWLAGDCNGCYPTFSNAMDTVLNGLQAGVWNHIQIQFPDFSGTGASYDLKLEQYQAPAPNAYFDNIAISTTGFVSAVPEPASTSLVFAGIVTAAWMRRHRS